MLVAAFYGKTFIQFFENRIISRVTYCPFTLWMRYFHFVYIADLDIGEIAGPAVPNRKQERGHIFYSPPFFVNGFLSPFNTGFGTQTPFLHGL